MNWQRFGWAVGLVLLIGFAGVGFWIGTLTGERASPEGDEFRPPPLPSPEEQIRRELTTAITGHDGEPLSVERTPEGWVIAVERKTDHLSVREILEGAAEMFHQLSRVGEPIARAEILYRTDALRDVYGNQLKDVAIAHIEMTKPNLERMDWRGFRPAHFPEVAERFWLHEELLRDWNEYRRSLEEGETDSARSQSDQEEAQDGDGGQEDAKRNNN